MAQGGVAKRLGDAMRRARAGSETLCEVALQAAEIDADAYRDAPGGGRARHRLYPLARTDVPRIDAKLVHARLDCRERQPVVEMYVGDKRNRTRPAHRSQGLRGFQIRHSQAEQVAAQRRAPRYLRRNRRRVVRLDVRHRLHAHGSASTDRHTADVHRPRFPRHLDVSLHFVSSVCLASCNRLGSVAYGLFYHLPLPAVNHR